MLNQLTSTEGAAPDLRISLITFLNKLDEALVFLEEDFKERSSRAGEGDCHKGSVSSTSKN